MVNERYDEQRVPDLPNLANLDYVDRVNRAIDHILANLSAPLALEDVARVACFSPYHFHRIFRALMGETLAAFVKRVRLERAVVQLSHRRGATVTEIALECGFSSSSDFSRSFRAQYGVPPRTFDVDRFRATGRKQLRSNLAPQARHRLHSLPPDENPDEFVATLRSLPARRVAYLRVQRPYAGQGVLDAVGRLRAWAEERGLSDGQWLGYQWDDPEIVPLDKCRYDVALVIPESIAVEGGPSTTRFAAMTVAELELSGPIELELRALDWLFGTFLPNSRYVPAQEPCSEVWKGAPFAHGTSHFELALHLPLVATLEERGQE